MDENIRAEYESKSKDLRADLKKWESEWATSHNGKKPERSDIKSNRDIGEWNCEAVEEALADAS